MEITTEITEYELTNKVKVALAEFIINAASKNATQQEIEVLANVADSFVKLCS